jgi:hypothetical protein
MESSGQLLTPVALLAGDSPRYLLDRRLGGLQGRFGHNGESSVTIMNLVLFYFCEKHII